MSLPCHPPNLSSEPPPTPFPATPPTAFCPSPLVHRQPTTDNIAHVFTPLQATATSLRRGVATPAARSAWRQLQRTPRYPGKPHSTSRTLEPPLTNRHPTTDRRPRGPTRQKPGQRSCTWDPSHVTTLCHHHEPPNNGRDPSGKPPPPFPTSPRPLTPLTPETARRQPTTPTRGHDPSPISTKPQQCRRNPPPFPPIARTPRHTRD